MADLPERYTKDVYRGIRYLASWLPSSAVAVGNVAVLQKGSLELVTTAEALGLSTQTIIGPSVAERGWVSQRTVTVAPKVGASGPLDSSLGGGAEMNIEFKAKHAILLRAERSREKSLDHLGQIKKEMLRLHEEGEWETDWILVTHVVHARRLIVLISNEKGASAQLRLSAGAVQDAGALITANGELDVTNLQGMALSEVGIKNATPLYQALRVRKRRLRGNEVKRIGKRGRARAGDGEFEIAAVSF